MSNLIVSLRFVNQCYSKFNIYLFFCPYYLFFVPLLAYAQYDTATTTNDVDTVLRNKIQTLCKKTTNSEEQKFQSTKSPWLAVGLSATLPGSGQFYNETYWKIPIILGLGGYWFFEWKYLNLKYKEYQSLYSQSIYERSPYGNEQYRRLRDFYRDERDKFAWYLGLLYFLNILDAYVGANLYDFDVGPNLSNRNVSSLTVGFRVCVNF